MGSDIGFIVGTAIIAVFGVFVGFVLPKVFEKAEGVDEENLRALRWIRWLGITLIIISLLLIVALIWLP